METRTLDGALYARMLMSGADHLSCYRTAVNDLNVFPIPDGDTGDNMLATVYGGADATDGAKDDLCDVANRSAHGMLLGARGNSGVILSRIFSGVSKGFAGVREASVQDVCKAFACGVDEAYRAVPEPVEGTILTVYGDGVRYANAQADGTTDLAAYFDSMVGEMQRSLERTPELLPVLKEAGVVDSGGAGLLYIVEGMRRVLAGERVEKAAAEHAQAAKADLNAFDENSELTFGYCTEVLLRLQRAKGDPEAFDLADFVDYLNSVGNSVVAFREGSIVKVHVHTMRPGDILNRCQRYGEFLTLKVENMSLQHNATELSTVAAKIPKARKKIGIVTVAAGEGLKDLFVSLGADAVIDGGQSMNPSTADFLDAFDRTNAETIFVFPNNSNIRMTAEQARDLYPSSDVRVLGTHSVGEGYAAMSMMDADGASPDEIERDLNDVIQSVTTGFVSRASRNAEKDGVHVLKGDFIGFIGDTIYINDGNVNDTAMQLAKEMHVENCGVLLLLVGRDVTDEQASALFASLTKAYPRTEVIRIDGGQPIHDYILVGE